MVDNTAATEGQQSIGSVGLYTDWGVIPRGGSETMKAYPHSGKRFLGGLIVAGCVAAAAVTPMAAHAASPGAATRHGAATLYRVPKRCQWILNDLANLSPADFPSLQAYQTAVRGLLAQLRACEAKY
jgi:hypothetical protein